VRIIKPSTVRAYASANPDAASALHRWMRLVRPARWRKLQEARQMFGSADEVRMKSGRNVVVFNIGGNKYRLIAAVHYNLGRVYVLRFLTHAEYDRAKWKDEL